MSRAGEDDGSRYLQSYVVVRGNQSRLDPKWTIRLSDSIRARSLDLGFSGISRIPPTSQRLVAWSPAVNLVMTEEASVLAKSIPRGVRSKAPYEGISSANRFNSVVDSLSIVANIPASPLRPSHSSTRSDVTRM